MNSQISEDMLAEDEVGRQCNGAHENETEMEPSDP